MSEGSHETNAGGVTAGEGEVIDGNGDLHAVGVVMWRAGSAKENLDEADEGEIEEESEEERGKEGAKERGG